jgi:hypothetical protein
MSLNLINYFIYWVFSVKFTEPFIITGQLIEAHSLTAIFLGQNVFVHYFVQRIEIVAVHFVLNMKDKLELTNVEQEIDNN